jgi:hypothetical protein
MKKIIRTALSARGASIEHVTRYMLAGSLVLITVGLILVAIFVSDG